MTLELLIGAEARSLLKEEVFKIQWNLLYTNCPWATIFQSHGFVTTWYEIYQEIFTPVLVREVMLDGSLGGLLTLGVTKDSQRLVCAGESLAEYHTWLARCDNGDTFIEAAMDALSVRFAQLTLVFQYLPPSTPKSWLASHQKWERGSRLEEKSRPLMMLGDGEQLKKSLRKSGNKSRLNRLKRMGEVSFEHCRTTAEFAEVFDDIITYYNFRKGAVNDVVPFQTDPLKKLFFLALMEIEDLLHVTVLKVGNRVVAAHLGIADGKQCVLGFPVHSPFDAVHSPGKLHLLMLGLELVQEGFEVLDLTPGGDEYKERSATDRDLVHILTVSLNNQPWQKRKLAAKLRFNSIVKKSIMAFGVEAEVAAEFGENIRRLRMSIVANWVQNLRARLLAQVEDRIYCLVTDEVRSGLNSQLINRDCLNDLLLFQPANSRQTRQEFLSLWMSRLEAGQHIYTCVENGCLVGYIGLSERPEQPCFRNVQSDDEFLPESVFLYDYCASIEPQSARMINQALLDRAIDDAVSIYGAKQVYISISRNHPCRDSIEQNFN